MIQEINHTSPFTNIKAIKLSLANCYIVYKKCMFTPVQNCNRTISQNIYFIFDTGKCIPPLAPHYIYGPKTSNNLNINYLKAKIGNTNIEIIYIVRSKYNLPYVNKYQQPYYIYLLSHSSTSYDFL